MIVDAEHSYGHLILKSARKLERQSRFYARALSRNGNPGPSASDRLRAVLVATAIIDARTS
jgi:hypothetical protein